MNKKPLTHIGQPVAELPVQDVVRAQAHYRDRLGFTVEWLYPGEEIGAVSRGEAVVFLRRRAQTFEPTVHWIFARTSRPPTANSPTSAPASSTRWKPNPGARPSSPSRTSTATGFTFTTADPATRWSKSA